MTTITNHTETQGPERLWINGLPQSGRVMAYISPIREIGSGKSLSLAEYIRFDLPTTTAINPGFVTLDEVRRLRHQFGGTVHSGLIERLLNTAVKLAEAIGSAAQRAGIYNGEAPLTGPYLLMLCDDLAKAARPAIDPVVMRAIAHELLRRFMGVYDTGDLDDAITILTKHLSGEAGKQEGK